MSLFSRAGRVRDVRLVSDRHTGRHKGAAYVEFDDRVAVAAAVQLSGEVLHGIPVAVRAWDDGGRGNGQIGGPAGSGTIARDGEGSQDVAVGWTSRTPMHRVESIAPPEDPSLTKQAKSTAVAQMVSIEELKLLLNPKGLPTAGFVNTKSVLTTPAARMTQNGFGSNGPQALERVPLPVAVGLDAATRVYVGGMSCAAESDELKRVFSVFGDVVMGEMEHKSCGPGGLIAVVEFASAASANKAIEAKTVVVGGEEVRVYSKRADVSNEIGSDLDRGRDTGVSLNSTRRTMLMQQLSRGEGVSGRRLRGDERRLETQDEESRCLILSNMFDPSKEPAGFEQDVAEDVRDECATQYGKVSHVHVEKESHGLVYVQFNGVEDAVKAQEALNGRWFGGNKIGAAFVKESIYADRFAVDEESES